MAFQWVYVMGGNDYMIDTDRNIKLINKPSAPEMPHMMELVTLEKRIPIEVIDETVHPSIEYLRGLNDIKDAQFDVCWKVAHIYAPECNDVERRHIMQSISDALIARGYNGNIKRANSVKVDFNHMLWG